MEPRNSQEVPREAAEALAGPGAAAEGGPPADAAPLMALVGATASGKTELALRLAEASGWEIVSMDSMLVYRGMDVGTAKPGPEEQSRVRHHVIDRVDPSESYDVQRYLADAQAAQADIEARGGRALFVGGTGFYLKALVYGLFQGPDVEPALRAELEARSRAAGPQVLHAELNAVDPVSAARIHANDVRRVVRALEVFQQSGRTLTEWQAQWSDDAPGRKRRLIGLRPRSEVLEERIRARTTQMIDAGWADEARAIRDGGGFSSTSIQALGYREILRYADGKVSRRQVEEGIALRTRQFARRQRTWYRKFSEIAWVDPECVLASTAATRELADRLGVN